MRPVRASQREHRGAKLHLYSPQSLSSSSYRILRECVCPVECVCVLKGRLPKCCKRTGDLSRNVPLGEKFKANICVRFCDVKVKNKVTNIYMICVLLCQNTHSQRVKSCVQPNTGDLLSQAVNGGRTPRTGRVQG